MSNSRVLNTIRLIQANYRQQYTADSPPLACSIDDISSIIFGQAFVGEEPDEILVKLVTNEVDDLVAQGFLKEIGDLTFHAHYITEKPTQYFELI